MVAVEEKPDAENGDKLDNIYIPFQFINIQYCYYDHYYTQHVYLRFKLALMYGINRSMRSVATHMTIFSCELLNTMYICIINIDQCVVLPEKNIALLIYCVFWERFSCWSLIHTLDYKNIMSMAFPMSEDILLDTLIIIISAILAEIE